MEGESGSMSTPVDIYVLDRMVQIGFGNTSGQSNFDSYIVAFPFTPTMQPGFLFRIRAKIVFRSARENFSPVKLEVN